MNFFINISKSIFSPEFYSQVLKKSTGSALSYFFLLALLLTLLQSVLPIWGMVTVGQKAIETVFNKVVASYPAELEVTVKNGTASTNVAEPYAIPLPKEAASEGDPGNMVVIDTQTPFSISQFNDYNTLAWLTKDSIFVRGSKDELRTIDLSQVSDYTVNKTMVDALADTVSPLLKFITPVFSVIILIGLYIIYLFRLIYAFLLAVFALLLTKLMKKSLTYNQSYKVVVYAMTPGFLVEVIVSWLGWSGFPFMFSLITLLIVFVNIRSVKNLSAKK